ncbi:MAG: hypothetical protein M1829_005333 [Trizodia sp. TS-e1964]|nr:MAG: hypothetical protein M1829_005333 [Trizodia sp. TS-e1964]
MPHLSTARPKLRWLLTRLLYIPRGLLLLLILLLLLLTSLWKGYQYGVASERLLQSRLLTLDDVPNRTGSNHTQIPRIIHHIYKDTAIPEKWAGSYGSCERLHPQWERVLWTDTMAAAFIAEQYPWFLACYQSYTYDIQRADALRYFLIYHFGGFYIDLDVGCRRALEPLVGFDALFPKTKPVGVSNDMMAGGPGHPFFYQLMHALERNNRWLVTKYPTVFFSTGPMFVNLQLASYIFQEDRNQTGSAVASSSVRILPSMFYDSTEHSFFAHVPGSSWHGNDVTAIFFIWNHLTAILSLLFFAILAFFFRRSLRARRAAKRADEEDNHFIELEDREHLLSHRA